MVASHTSQPDLRYRLNVRIESRGDACVTGQKKFGEGVRRRYTSRRNQTGDECVLNHVLTVFQGHQALQSQNQYPQS